MSTSLIARLRAFAASADGSLLDDATWKVRHARISHACWAVTAFVLAFTIVDDQETRQWLFAPLMAILVLAARREQLGRRPREVIVAATFVSSQLFISRYVGNVTGLGAIYIIILSFYQDWVPIAIATGAAFCLLVLAAVDPSFFASNRGFQAEQPFTGMGFRTLSIALAALLSLAVWRYGTQLSRDQLTGMLSRAGAERILQSEMNRGAFPAVWVSDLDNFRSVNAELGSDAGDQLLQHVARQLERVAASLPGSWLCARLRADTFLIAVYDCPDDSFVEEFAHRIEEEAGLPAGGIAVDDIPVRLSVGGAVAMKDDNSTDLIRAAERGMARAKGQGMARVVIEQRTARTRTASTERAASLLISEVYRGCENQEFDLYLQPIVSLADGQPVGAEALVRWNHPVRGLLNPSTFLPEAERDSALMAVLSRALGARFATLVSGLVDRHGVDWLPHGYTFNIAAIRFRDPTLIASLDQLLGSVGRAHAEHKVTLEVTEGALMDIEAEVVSLLWQIKEKGYRIALDDFGTGHSSLAHLRDFPLDIVKIDQSFAQSVDRSPTDRAVVEAVAHIATASGLTIVAEGVETEAQREILHAISPDMLGQGWLYATPLPVDQFEDWVIDRKRAALV